MRSKTKCQSNRCYHRKEIIHHSFLRTATIFIVMLIARRAPSSRNIAETYQVQQTIYSHLTFSLPPPAAAAAAAAAIVKCARPRRASCCHAGAIPCCSTAAAQHPISSLPPPPTLSSPQESARDHMPRDLVPHRPLKRHGSTWPGDDQATFRGMSRHVYERIFDPRMVLYPPRVRRDFDIGPRRIYRRALASRASVNHQAATGVAVGVSTLCGVASARGITIFVPGLSEL